MAKIKNLEKAAQRIKKAIEKKERIILYGDGDLDGTTSVILLKESIQSLGGRVAEIYFPNREKEGYGLTEKGLSFLEKRAPALLVMVDMGIGNFKEVKAARKKGLEVVIIDHHEILDKVPEANIVVDPKQKGDKYPFKSLAAVGLVFKLTEALFDEKMPESLRRSFLELAALASIADMVPKKEDNEVLIDGGRGFLEDSWRPGLKAFFETKSVKELVDLNLKISKIISILNVREINQRLPASFRLLTAKTEKEAKVLIVKLLKKNAARKKKIETMLQSIEKTLGGNEEIILREDPVSMPL
jgi:single-stranded-DNA-specific exonuclease